MNYAQVDETKRVYAVSQLTDIVNTSNMIAIEIYDVSLIGKYYNPDKGTFEEVTATVNKNTIATDGIDTAIVTAKVPTVLTEITFYHADTGEAIATVPVDPATHTATLQVTATTPGMIRIRAGESTITSLNEVVINAT